MEEEEGEEEAGAMVVPPESGTRGRQLSYTVERHKVMNLQSIDHSFSHSFIYPFTVFCISEVGSQWQQG